MIDIKFLRENPEVVKENIRKKFQDKKLPLVDEIIKEDVERRDIIGKTNNLKKERNDASKQVSDLMKNVVS